MNDSTRTVTLAAHSNGRPVAPTDFAIVDEELPALTLGQARLRTTALSVDPALPLGSPIFSTGVAEVMESTIDGVDVGDVVTGLMAWSETSIWRPVEQHPHGVEMLTKVHPFGGTLAKVDPLVEPSSHVLGALGVNGITAYFGMLAVGKPRAGETVLVSGAAGGIGSLAGQIAKLEGARGHRPRGQRRETSAR
jgi:NADPH-dependent curcumin reductase CurA